ncbi:magnesium chelatase subunit ChlI-like protein [Novosphingobium sp. PhB55]|nr:magnesium chelatase subunit ChlI-like protein [Novosphingobium sp. PhB55]
MIASVAGTLEEGRISRARPFRSPHHSASMAALTGGGLKVRPGEVSMAHLGVLFLDELPEFQRAVLDSLRQPLEIGEVTVARANAHVTYPARVQLIAAMNPCRCGYLSDPALACSRVPKCAADYQSKVSGPLLDSIASLFKSIKRRWSDQRGRHVRGGTKSPAFDRSHPWADDLTRLDQAAAALIRQQRSRVIGGSEHAPAFRQRARTTQ